MRLLLLLSGGIVLAMLGISGAVYLLDAGRGDTALSVYLLAPLAGAGVAAFKATTAHGKRASGAAKFHGITWIMTLMVLFLVHATRLLDTAQIETSSVAMVSLGIAMMAGGNLLPKLRRNRWTGFINPWTVGDEVIWDRTHRLAGMAMMLGGAAVVTAPFLTDLSSTRLAMLSLSCCLPTLVATGYSLQLKRRLYRAG